MLATPDACLLDLFGAAPSASGVAVTPQSAMRCTPVRAAVLAIAETVGQLDLRIYQCTDGAKAPAPDHPLTPLLIDAANDWTSAAEFRQQLTIDALLHGNGYAFVNSVDGKPVELIRLRPEGMSVTVDLVTAEPIYRAAVDDKGGTRIIPRQNIVHIRAPSVSGIIGDSPVAQAREAIGLALVLERKAFEAFCRKGVERMGADEVKSLTVGTSSAGGYLAPNQFSTELLKLLVQFSPIRQYAKTTAISASSIKFPRRVSSLSATWVDETAARTESEPVFEQVPITPFELGTYVDVSNQLLERDTPQTKQFRQ